MFIKHIQFNFSKVQTFILHQASKAPHKLPFFNPKKRGGEEKKKETNFINLLKNSSIRLVSATKQKLCCHFLEIHR